MSDISHLQYDRLKAILSSWEEVNTELCRKMRWNLVMIFPSFTVNDGMTIHKVIDGLKAQEIVEFDTRYVDGDIDFAPSCLAPTIENIMGNDDRCMFAVPRVLTTCSVDFVVLMTSEYWCLYADRALLELAVGMSLDDFQQKTTQLLMDSYSEDDLLVYRNKLSDLSKAIG